MTESSTPQRRRRGRGMPPEELELRYPSLTYLTTQPPNQSAERAWVAAFNARPDAMTALLGDLIKQVYATPGRIGQRPMPKEADVDLEGLIYGEENDLPLPQVIRKFSKVSERNFYTRTLLSRSQFRRLMAGEYDPDVSELRAIAAALGKPPVFLVEYRKAMALAAFVNLINERPGIATNIYRKYLEVRLS